MDGKKTKRVYTGYFWNGFLPLLLFVLVAGLLFFIMKTPDEYFPTPKNTVGAFGKNLKSN